jgi:hypothetical protein
MLDRDQRSVRWQCWERITEAQAGGRSEGTEQNGKMLARTTQVARVSMHSILSSFAWDTFLESGAFSKSALGELIIIEWN